MRSPNYDTRPEGVSPHLLILHYTGMESDAAALVRLCDDTAKVSAHYFIAQNGEITPLVDEDKRAWHAGRSFWQGIEDINAHSLGIEIANAGHAGGCPSYPRRQMEALAELSLDIARRYAIQPRHVLGHSDIAPERKQDPGEHFDWAFLAEAGVGLWHPPAPADALLAEEEATPVFLSALRRFGYRAEAGMFSQTLTAFQRHFRPERIDGKPDHATLTQLNAILAAAEA